ncbi:GNAT family N-acetyltransferase [Jiangella rhizosphaerae]|uniref:GNAT family N-acetyltransferase n=1 Tax=Jiangella rhizosphaerae TaxID=2293569 RepID=A0A418KPZ2_9ACTN|nr:GNAT family N-acetyltransferase [Jiangella rhizosphaerae]RIQ21500.1 GNAT family N-acetyltransferase [Jiangella rhizosphaerae]
MTDFHVRPARPADHAAVARITVAAYDADGFLDGDEEYADELSDIASRSNQATLLVAADEDGTVLGAVTFCRPPSPYVEVARPGEAEFRMLAVDPAARGRGVGAALVQACLDLAREHGDDAVVLSSLPRMHTAHRLYERLGFVRTPERDHEPIPGFLLIAYHRRV